MEWQGGLLSMIHEKIKISTLKETKAYMKTYLLENYEEIDPNRRRPLVLICPGGGYEFTTDREAEAVAMQYLAKGYHACVLRYSVKPAEFPKALGELAWCVAYLKEHAVKYGICAEKIILAGFSAGGHLAASLGVFWDKEWLAKETGLSKEQMRPGGLILSYPVITSGQYAHRGSFDQLMGNSKNKELQQLLSLEEQVSENVPPVFIWHTLTDEAVPVENMFLFVRSLQKFGVLVEAHLFPKGQHGLALANEETMIKNLGFGVEKHCQKWMELSIDWIQNIMEES